MNVYVPFDGENPKTRLSPVLSPAERTSFARTMLRDVLEAITEAGAEPIVLSSRTLDGIDAEIRVDDQPLSDAVNAALEETPGTVAVIMADLPLITSTTVERLLERTGEVVLARGLGGGTNAIVSAHPEFTVDYHGTSYLDHLERAESIGASVSTVDSYRLAQDIDEPDDLVELLVHGDKRTREWLDEAGFRLETKQGRTSIRRAVPHL